jgi:hypothetical protein
MDMSSRRRSGTVDHGMASAYADQAIDLRDSVSLAEQDLAIATGASQATVAAWLAGIAAPDGAHAGRLIELAVIVRRLARTMTADATPGWLNTAVPVLDGQQPLELIAGGQYERLARGVASFEAPVFT